MPLVKIEILEGNSAEYKKAVLDGVHSALVEAFKIPDRDRTQRLYELSDENFEINPGKTRQCTLIEITAFPGRSRHAKKNLYQSIVANLARAPGIPPADITITLVEPPFENWGIRGGKMSDEVEIGFDLKV